MARKPVTKTLKQSAKNFDKGKFSTHYEALLHEIDTEVESEPVNLDTEVESESVNLALALTRKPTLKYFEIWLIGDTPLIVHAWSHKAKMEMLGKQVKAAASGREIRDPREDFESSLYRISDDVYGIPAMGIKNCIVNAAHKDKGIPKTAVRAALWIDATLVRVPAANPMAVCDMPLIRLYGAAPEMREDMVRVGAGMNKTANLAYRAQFSRWAVKVTGRFNSDVLTEEVLSFLIAEAGVCDGLHEWRPSKNGVFGTFHLGSADESSAWDAFAAGNGPLPSTLAIN